MRRTLLLISLLLATTLTPMAARADQCRWEKGWLSHENARPGSPEWSRGIPVRSGVWDSEKASLRAEGFFNRFSVACGEVAKLELSLPARIAIYRLGDYQGAGARLVKTAQVKKYWSFTADSTMPPGQYVVRIYRDGSLPRLVPIMVIDRQSSAPITFVSSVYTWQAYNRSGGKSLYKGGDGTSATAAKVVSFNRPYDGAGTGRMRWMESPLLRILEESGKDINYLTDDDVSNEALARTISIIVGGHNEYWSEQEYSAFTDAVSRGVNFVAFGGNTGYRQIFIKDRTGGLRATHRLLNKPESQLLGSQYFSLGYKSDLVVTDSTRWPFNAIAPRTTIKDIYGYEVDTYMNAPGPAVEVLASSAIAQGTVVATSTYYNAPSGAGVLNFATNGWVCAMEDLCAWNHRFNVETMTDIKAVTRSVIADLDKGPLAKIHPALATINERP